MFLLWFGVTALFIGPLVVTTVGHHAAAASVLDAFVVMAIGGLVFLHIIPECLAEAGWPVLAAVLLGALWPTLLHSPLQAMTTPCSTRGTRSLFVLAAIALGLHAVLDGVAMAPRASFGLTALFRPAASFGPTTHFDPHVNFEHAHLAVAVVLHRLLEGTALWYLMRPPLGRWGAVAAMGGLGIATFLGYFGAPYALHAGGETALAWIQAGVAGSLLHVLAHHAPQAKQGSPWLSAAGMAAAGMLLYALTALEELAQPHGHSAAAVGAFGANLWQTCACLGQQVAPWVIASLGITAVLHAVAPAGLPPLSTTNGSPARHALQPWRQALWGALCGLCTDAAFARLVPLYNHTRGNTANGPTTQTNQLAFLCTAPTFGVSAGLVSLACQGSGPTLARVGVLAVWAAGTAWALQAARATPKRDHAPGAACAGGQPLRRGRLADGVHFALGETVDHLAPWLLFGLLLAGLLDQGIENNALASWASRGWDVPLLATVAAPVYLSPVTAALMGAVLWHKGATVGGVAAFIVCSSAISVVGLRLLSRLYARWAAWTIVLALFGLSISLGTLLNLRPTPTAQLMHSQDLPKSLSVAAGTLALLCIQSCARLGIRRFLAPITAWSMRLGPHHHHHH